MIRGEFDRRDHPAVPASLGPGAVLAVALALALWLARHWLALANSANFLLVAGSAATPLMAAGGLTAAAGPAFAAYHLVCHQLPERSFFLLGYQMAMCQRNVAIYGSMAAAGLAFGLVRGRMEPLPWRWYLAAALPMAVDGFSQLMGLRESTWELRLATGALFGASTVGLAYPYLERFAGEVLSGQGLGGTQGDSGEPGETGSAPGRCDVPASSTQDLGTHSSVLSSRHL